MWRWLDGAEIAFAGLVQQAFDDAFCSLARQIDRQALVPEGFLDAG